MSLELSIELQNHHHHKGYKQIYHLPVSCGQYYYYCFYYYYYYYFVVRIHNICYLPSKFYVYNIVFSVIVTTLYSRSPEFILQKCNFTFNSPETALNWELMGLLLLFLTKLWLVSYVWSWVSAFHLSFPTYKMRLWTQYSGRSSLTMLFYVLPPRGNHLPPLFYTGWKKAVLYRICQTLDRWPLRQICFHCFTSTDLNPSPLVILSCRDYFMQPGARILGPLWDILH